MPRFQNVVAVILGASVLCSITVFYITRPREGKIQLPIHSDDDRPPDPFDVSQPVDFIDGIAINAKKFWEKMRRRKIILSFLLAAILILKTICFGWAIVEDEPWNVASYAIHVFFSLYLLAVAIRSVNQDAPGPHSESVFHLTTLTTLATIFLGISILLPTDPPPVATSVESSEAFTWIWITVFIIYTITCLLSFTTPQGPPLHYEPKDIYSTKEASARTNKDEVNVTGVTGKSSPWETLFFSYSTKVVMLGNTATSLEISDLPIVPVGLRATFNYTRMKNAVRTINWKIGLWRPKPGSGWNLGYRLVRLNLMALFVQFLLASVSACVYYVPPYFLRQLVSYLEVDPERRDTRWGWVYVAGLFGSNAISYLITGQLWSLSTTVLQVRFKIQLNTILFAKTLVRKDVASSAPSTSKKTPTDNGSSKSDVSDDKKDDEDDFSSKAQIMTLMTTDVDRLSEFAWHMFTLIDSPIEIVIGSIFLYKLLGISCFFGLAVTCLFLPMNHFAGSVVVGAQDNLMKARDERISLMNEILGAIRMLKFMAWERSFEARVLEIREKELKYQKLNYTIETMWNAIWYGIDRNAPNASPILVTLVSFWHFTVIRKQDLTPSIAFTSVMFNELKFALNALPETFINMLQSLVSMRRIEKYLNANEVSPVLPVEQQSQIIAFQSCTVTWPQERIAASKTPSTASTPRHKFILVDLSLRFPPGELSLICGKLGSGKTLLLHALLGEADVLAGQMLCPRSPPDAIASFKTILSREEWVVQGICAYVPQAAWLRNASIKDNILFNLPFDAERYRKTLEVCALTTDLEILEDGDEAEIGERGVNLSGGQKARVSLARAVYSRASILLLDDVLSAVDAHTAHHLYHECLKGELMQGLTVILVSHHVQLCAEGAGYIIALDNGRVQFEGTREDFQKSGVIRTLVQSAFIDDKDDVADDKEEEVIEAGFGSNDESESSSTVAPASEVTDTKAAGKKPPRKLVEEEKRAIGRIGKDIWLTYINACGSSIYWSVFLVVFILAALSPVAENGWLKYWSHTVLEADGSKGPVYYIAMYAIITAIGLIITTLRWLVLYRGSIHASVVLYQRLLETVLFANIRFHDTVSRGRLLNRFGKDFEGIDSSLSDNFGRSTMYAMSSLTTLVTVSVVGGLPFIAAAFVLAVIYYNVAKVYGQTSRDMRRLDSVTRSPLYSIYGETIAGVSIIRAFGASSKFLRDMLRCVDTNCNPYYWMWGVNRWLSIRFNLLSCAITGVTAAVTVLTPRIDASLAGFTLAFASSITNDLLFMVRRFVGLEQSMVALERVKEYSELVREPPEFIEPRPPQSWPSHGAIKCEDLVIRYAPDLPNVLHHLNFEIQPGEKIGILGRTGSGKSTLALSFFRFVEATEGRILIDDLDIASIGLTDLRSKITIIPQDPTILSGTVRSTLDVFDEYQDAEIFEALRRVHLIPANSSVEDDVVNANMFRNLDSPVSEGGDNFSTGEKQLLCMARAILKRSKVLVMDEATASVDYATDELIGKTIRQEFSESTILTIAHRLRTVIDYDRVMLLDQGRIVEFDRPKVLLSDSASKFHALCKATGKEEFAALKKMAGV
ncbi:multidrug resistance-associated ABC transporter [Guyanagaster necrorhizus]|uniref:Multidrug resistance-associated ABC transporter n=1 Tax=Guyanagaster necrorhizus TaxID=856835 RepID=A0A9P7VWF0_9AGAR|nr:multidrug resistance-associated ABC transporter [Guyanagaster necrorhizus MCA 3950]KAG7448558.1 multidrug resistance-associated ABC transporter [Guyanagaster necrorhizus MCA 3950]